jgi:hypothetical protein
VTRLSVVLAISLYGAGAAAAQTPVSAGPPAAQPADELINPDRPGIADGSAVIGRGRFQLETGFQQEFRNDGGGTQRTSFLPTLVRVGITSRWEARLESNTFTDVRSSATASQSPATSGLAPVSFGAKFHIQDSAGLRQPSVGAIVRVFPMSGTSTFHTKRVTGDVRLAADWDVSARLSLNPNAGVAFYEDDSHRFTAGLIAVTLSYFNTAKTINPFVDMGAQVPEAPSGEASVIFDAGVAYLPGRNLQIDASVGAGAHGRTPPHPFFSVGLSLRLRP